MTGLLSGREDETESLRRVGEMLRVLVHVSQPFRGPTATLPLISRDISSGFGESASSEEVLGLSKWFIALCRAR
jgi:hypothetical protein